MNKVPVGFSVQGLVEDVLSYSARYGGVPLIGWAALLVMFHGCKHIPVAHTCTDIDMHSDVERLSGVALAESEKLAREGLRNALERLNVPC